eukprot:TRINITY_DN22099_c0_g1_i1.p1 TRINITY_DN22099_c0_g1~~TRINITY_DN22099_c0_g1_i1.p1  ORF type:complete len:381 (-),score=87.98 TRINITY_DN22099_c0_g1_i1:97-1239(-)
MQDEFLFEEEDGPKAPAWEEQNVIAEAAEEEAGERKHKHKKKDKKKDKEPKDSRDSKRRRYSSPEKVADADEEYLAQLKELDGFAMKKRTAPPPELQGVTPAALSPRPRPAPPKLTAPRIDKAVSPFAAKVAELAQKLRSAKGSDLAEKPQSAVERPAPMARLSRPRPLQYKENDTADATQPAKPQPTPDELAERAELAAGLLAGKDQQTNSTNPDVKHQAQKLKELEGQRRTEKLQRLQERERKERIAEKRRQLEQLTLAKEGIARFKIEVGQTVARLLTPSLGKFTDDAHFKAFAREFTHLVVDRKVKALNGDDPKAVTRAPKFSLDLVQLLKLTLQLHLDSVLSASSEAATAAAALAAHLQTAAPRAPPVKEENPLR